jgi:ubiquitin fusion degradation protein 1
MRSLRLESGEAVTLKSVVLPKGEFLKFQPHSQDFLAFYDYDKDKILGLLEWALPNFSAVAAGDTIEIRVENKVFALNVLETRPASAVSLVSEPYLDVKLEFATPLDFVEPARKEEPMKGS